MRGHHDLRVVTLDQRQGALTELAAHQGPPDEADDRDVDAADRVEVAVLLGADRPRAVAVGDLEVADLEDDAHRRLLKHGPVHAAARQDGLAVLLLLGRQRAKIGFPVRASRSRRMFGAGSGSSASETRWKPWISRAR